MLSTELIRTLWKEAKFHDGLATVPAHVLEELAYEEGILQPSELEYNELAPNKKAVFTPTDSCNRHNDCNKADTEAKARGAFGASHCHDECCEDCFGC